MNNKLNGFLVEDPSRAFVERLNKWGFQHLSPKEGYPVIRIGPVKGFGCYKDISFGDITTYHPECPKVREEDVTPEMVAEALGASTKHISHIVNVDGLEFLVDKEMARKIIAMVRPAPTYLTELFKEKNVGREFRVGLPDSKETYKVIICCVNGTQYVPMLINGRSLHGIWANYIVVDA